MCRGGRGFAQPALLWLRNIFFTELGFILASTNFYIYCLRRVNWRKNCWFKNPKGVWRRGTSLICVLSLALARGMIKNYSFLELKVLKSVHRNILSSWETLKRKFNCFNTNRTHVMVKATVSISKRVL